MKRYPHIISVLICCAMLLPIGISAKELTLSFDHYYNGPEVTEAVQTLHEKYPNLTELRVLGQSEEDRDIWLLTINNPGTGKDTEKPGVYIDGAIHGNEIQATEVCLYLATYLLDEYDELPAVKELVDNRAFYIIPTVNVDSRSRFFSHPSGYNVGRTAIVPYDDDRDGLADEDNYDDLDGDGEILRMRIRDLYGDWKSHPDDPRVMIRVEPGEKGEWRRLGSEGIDNDGDGRINEDGPGYLDMNRNYGFKWQPPYVQGGAGDFPMSSKPTKIVSDFVVSKPNICFNIAYHNMGGLIIRGPGSKLAGRYPQSDVRVYDFLGEEGEKIIPGYRYIVGMEDMYTTHGDFDEWMFSNMGIYGFVGELFMDEQEHYRKVKPDKTKEKPEDEEDFYRISEAVEKHKFDDNVTQGSMFREWKKFNHPQLGEIEIGGWKKFTSRVSPVFMLMEMVHRNASLVMFIASHAPEVELELIDVTDIGNGLKQVRVRAVNQNVIPTLSGNAVRRNIYRKDIISLEGNGIEVVSGGIVDDLLFDKVSTIEHRPWMVFTTIPSFGTREVQWIVRGSGKATVTFDSIKSKNQSLSVTL